MNLSVFNWNTSVHSWTCSWSIPHGRQGKLFPSHQETALAYVLCRLWFDSVFVLAVLPHRVFMCRGEQKSKFYRQEHKHLSHVSSLVRLQWCEHSMLSAFHLRRCLVDEGMPLRSHSNALFLQKLVSFLTRDSVESRNAATWQVGRNIDTNRCRNQLLSMSPRIFQIEIWLEKYRRACAYTCRVTPWMFMNQEVWRSVSVVAQVMATIPAVMLLYEAQKIGTYFPRIASGAPPTYFDAFHEKRNRWDFFKNIALFFMIAPPELSECVGQISVYSCWDLTRISLSSDILATCTMVVHWARYNIAQSWT